MQVAAITRTQRRFNVFSLSDEITSSARGVKAPAIYQLQCREVYKISSRRLSQQQTTRCVPATLLSHGQHSSAENKLYWFFYVELREEKLP